MSSNSIVWDSFLKMAEHNVDLELDSTPLRNSLLPAPLRLNSTTPSTPRFQGPSPPASPSPTVIVSLQVIEPGQPAPGQLSLHEYRKNLSRPQSNHGVSPAPGRTLKRKPKAANLNQIHTHRAPLSPPPTPPPLALLPAYTFPQSETLESQVNHFNQNYHYDNLYSPQFTPATAEESYYSPTTTPTTNTHPERTPLYCNQSTTRNKPHSRRLASLRDCLWQIPVRFISHNKSVSESALPISQTSTGRTLRHRGVSFEILDPKEYTQRSSTENVMADLEKNATPTQPRHDAVRSVSSPSPGYRRRSLSLGAEQRRTPSRALFEDLPTAYLSIASRVANRRSRFLTSSPDSSYSSGSCARQIPNQGNNLFQITSVSSGPPHSSTQRFGCAMDAVAQPMTPPLSPNETNNTQVILLPKRDLVQRTPQSLNNEGITKFVRHEQANRRPNRSTQFMPERICGHNPSISPRSRPVLTTFLNPHQPNLHGARGRIDKPKTIGDVIKKRPSRSNMAAMDVYNHEYVENTKRSAGLQGHLTPQPRVSISESPPEPLSSVGQSFHETSPTEGRRDSTGFRPLIVPRIMNAIDRHDTQGPLRRAALSSPNFSRPIGPFHPTNDNCDDPFITSAPASKSSPYIDKGQKLPHSSHSPAYNTAQLQNKGSVLSALSCQSVSSIGENCSPNKAANPLGDDVGGRSFGPGSSQSSSSYHLSQHTMSSAALRSHQRLPSISSQDNQNSNPFFHGNVERHQSLATAGHGTESNRRNGILIDYDIDGDSDLEEEDCTEKDWETVADSQQFRSTSGNPLTHVESGSSLADYSSFGSLANKRLASRASLHSHRRRFFPDPSRGSVRGPVSQWRPTHSYHSRQFFDRSIPHQDPSLGIKPESSRSNDLSDTAPALKASTTKSPAARLYTYSLYQHPAPLNGYHTNPFQSEPPSLTEQKLRGHSNSDKSNSGCLSAIRSSKLNFHDKNNSPSIDDPESGILHQEGVEGSPQSQGELPLTSSAWHSEPSIHFTQPSYPNSHQDVYPSQHRTVVNNTSLPPKILLPQNNVVNAPETKSAADNIHSKNPLPLTEPSSRPLISPCQWDHEIPGQYQPTHRRDNSSIAPSRANSSESLIPRARPAKYPPGSLYLSIRSARNRVLGDRTRQTSTHNSVSTTNELLSVPKSGTRPISSAQQYCESRIDDGESRRSRSKSALAISPSTTGCPPTRNYSTRSYMTRSERSREPDEILRERLDRMETTTTLADFTSLCPTTSRASRRAGACPIREPHHSAYSTSYPASRQYAVSRGASSLFASIDEESTTHSDWYCSANGRYAFPEPPRLVSRLDSYHSHDYGRYATATAIESSLIAQKHLGRQLILWFSLAVPLGWFVVAFIGFGNSLANFLIRWRSKGFVNEFNEKERRLARRLGVVYSVFILVFALVVLAVVLAQS